MPVAARTTRNARRNRDNSPPDAILLKGPGGAFGMVTTSKTTRSPPSGPQAFSSSASTRVEKRARPSIKGASSAETALSSFLAAFSRAALRRVLEGAIGFTGLAGSFAQGLDAFLASLDGFETGGEFLRKRGEVIDLALMLAGGGAKGEQPRFDLFQPPRLEIELAVGVFQPGDGLARLDKGALHRLQAADPAAPRRVRQPAPGAGSPSSGGPRRRRPRRRRPGLRSYPPASFSAFIMSWRSLGELRLLARFGLKRRQLVDGMAEIGLVGPGGGAGLDGLGQARLRPRATPDRPRAILARSAPSPA